MSNAGGSTWTEKTKTHDFLVVSIAHGSIILGGRYDNGPEQVMAVTISTDDGQTWNCTELSETYGITNVVVTDPDNQDHIFAGGYYQTPQTWNTPAFFKSENGGADWEDITFSMEGYPICLGYDPFDHNKMYMGTSRRFYISHNRGDTWTTDGNYYSVRDIICDPIRANTIYAATSSGVMLSQNGGNSWSAINDGLPSWDVTCLEYNSVHNVLYAGTASRGVYRLSKPTGIGHSDMTGSRPGEPVLHQNTPNPFNMNTVIRFQIMERSPVRVEIFDLQGRLIRRLWDKECNPGLFKVNWDGKDNNGRNLASGIYVYRLRTDQKIDHRKMILQK